MYGLGCGASCPCQACQQQASMGMDGYTLGLGPGDIGGSLVKSVAGSASNLTPWGAASNAFQAGAGILTSVIGVGGQYLVGKQQAAAIKAQAAQGRLTAREAEKDRELQEQLVFAQATQQERQQMYDASSQRRNSEVIALSGIGLVAVGISILFIYNGMKKR